MRRLPHLRQGRARTASAPTSTASSATRSPRATAASPSPPRSRRRRAAPGRPTLLNDWLFKPQNFAKGTKMTFVGLPKAKDRADVIAYLNSLSDSPKPLAGSSDDGSRPARPAAGRRRAHRACAARARADAAGRDHRAAISASRIAVDDKADLTPVTIADREAEAAMRALIEAALSRARHHRRGARHASRGDAEFVWVLDPIDGTKNFISGMPLFGTLIALAQRGRAGPGRDRPADARASAGSAPRASRRPSTARRSGRAPAPRSPRRRSSPPRPTCSAAPTPRRFERLKARGQARALRRRLLRLCASSPAASSTSSSRRDLKPYDYCALVPVIAGAGGAMTDWAGRALTIGSTAASSPPAIRARRPARAALGS